MKIIPVDFFDLLVSDRQLGGNQFTLIEGKWINCRQQYCFWEIARESLGACSAAWMRLVLYAEGKSCGTVRQGKVIFY